MCLPRSFQILDGSTRFLDRENTVGTLGMMGRVSRNSCARRPCGLKETLIWYGIIFSGGVIHLFGRHKQLAGLASGSYPTECHVVFTIEKEGLLL